MDFRLLVSIAAIVLSAPVLYFALERSMEPDHPPAPLNDRQRQVKFYVGVSGPPTNFHAYPVMEMACGTNAGTMAIVHHESPTVRWVEQGNIGNGVPGC